MNGTPNTVGVLLLFFLVFLVCILWATRGKEMEVHHDDADYGSLEKPS